MELAAVPLPRHQRVLFDHGALKHRHVRPTTLDGRGNQLSVLCVRIRLRDGRRSWAVAGRVNLIDAATWRVHVELEG